MSKGEKFIGRRLPLINGKLQMPTEPGDYCGPINGFSGDKPAMFFLLPIARKPDISHTHRSVHHITFPPHQFTENPDGTLTIHGSILSRNDHSAPSYHCYLQSGVWIED
jgi:hypothetical protein